MKVLFKMRIQKLLSELMSREVEIQTLAGTGNYTDKGVVESYDEDFIRLRKGNGEILYIGVRYVRLIKPKVI